MPPRCFFSRAGLCLSFNCGIRSLAFTLCAVFILSCSGVADDLLKMPCGLRLMVSVTISIVTSCCQWKSHIMRLLISLWDVGTVFFTIYPQVFRHEKSSIYYKYIEPLSYCFSISFKILIITVYGFMKWYICKCLFCKVYLLDLSYNRNAKPMTGSNELRFNLTQIRG